MKSNLWIRILSRNLSAWLPVFLWMALIFKFSSGQVPSASLDYWTDFAVKKTGHVLLFGALALLTYRALLISGFSKKTAAWTSVFFTFFYGATDEYHQSFTSGRGPHIRDVFIDGLGAFFVISLLYYLPVKLNPKLQNLLEKINLK